MKDRFVMLLGVGLVFGVFFYGSLMKDSVLCYKVPVCPEIRTALASAMLTPEEALTPEQREWMAVLRR